MSGVIINRTPTIVVGGVQQYFVSYALRVLDEMEQANPHVGIFRESLYQDFLAFYDENGYLPSAEDVDFELASPEVTA